MPPRKGDLISLTFNCGPQQLDYFVLIKYEQVTAHLGFVGKADGGTGPWEFRSPSHVDRSASPIFFCLTPGGWRFGFFTFTE
jgi:hypothetical protein